MSNLQAVLIAGPTASGKSGLAAALAEAWNGAVINADSMQVYRELRILTARPGPADEARAPHWLYGHVSANEAYSTGRWLTGAGAALARARDEGKLPIVTGGTGLYFMAMLEGLSPVPEIPAEIRAHWRAEGERLGPAALYAILRERDAAMAARLQPSDPQRLIRALEVLEATGQSLSLWQAAKGAGLLARDKIVNIVLTLDREALYRRCDERFAAMAGAGALGETEALLKLGLSPALPAMRAIGVAHFAAHIRGEITLAEAVERGQTETRRYAKRQLTWTRRNMITWNYFSAQQMERTKHEIDKLIMSMLDPPAPAA